VTLDAKYEHKHEEILKDTRPWRARTKDKARNPSTASLVFTIAACAIYIEPSISIFADIIFIVMSYYFYWLLTLPVELPFKLPKSAGIKDPNNRKPGGGIDMAEGIMYLGNKKDGEEVWFNNNDARTHILYLGTTGSGKTVGLMGISTNALCWASGYVYIDGKADTDLWSKLSALARRFGRDDDVLIMNYMTGNAGGRVPSNTLNPFSSGSASYLVNMLVSLMPEGGGDNDMWKDRAVSLISAIMPCLVWRRDNQNIPMSIAIIRTFLTFPAIIKLSRSKDLPDDLLTPVKAYLDELPGYVDDVFDDDGNEKQMGPEAGAVDTATPRQQHGYLSMQFTRSMSSLGDDYGFIFNTQAADVDMLDVVINRRILVVLIPALEKSSDETANLGKIIASTLKGMMGATLGSTVEGDTATAIENKPTTSATPFISIFDEVGYYAAQGMAVMAAQARSLGFCLVFAAQDMPALEKRVKEEARSITANCNIKIFGKLEDPTQTKEFFEKTVGQAIVTEASGYEKGQQSSNASIQVKARASYDGLKDFTEGQAVCAFGKNLAEMTLYYADVGHAKAMRVQRLLSIPPPSANALDALQQVSAILTRFRDPEWKAQGDSIASNTDITALAKGFSEGLKSKIGFIESGSMAVANVAKEHNLINLDELAKKYSGDSNEGKDPKKKLETPLKTDNEKTLNEANIKPEPSSDAPISWGNLIGIEEEPVSEIEQKQNIDTADNSVSKEIETPPTKKSGEPISWQELIGMDEEDEIKLPTAEDINNNIEEPLQPSDDNMLEQNILATNDVISWGDIIGIDTGESSDNNPIEEASSVEDIIPEESIDPVAEEEENLPPITTEEPIKEKEENLGDDEESGNAIGWGDVIKLSENEEQTPPPVNTEINPSESNAVNWKDLEENNEQEPKHIEKEIETNDKKEVAKNPISWSDLIGINLEEKENSSDENNNTGDV